MPQGVRVRVPSCTRSRLQLMMNKSTIVGVFTVASLIILGVFFRFICGGSFSPMNTYSVILDRSHGVNVGTDVYINGYKVGNVFNIGLLHDTFKVKVDFRISKTIKLKDDSRVCISKGLLGGTRLDIEVGSGKCVELNSNINCFAREGSIDGVVMEVNAIVGKISDISQALGNMSGVINLNISRLNDVIVNVANISKNIDSVVVDFKSDYKKMSKEFSNVGTLLARVTSVFTKIDSSLKVITGKIEKDNIIGNVGEIVKEVKDISKKVNVIVDEFSKNPNRFIKLF